MYCCWAWVDVYLWDEIGAIFGLFPGGPESYSLGFDEFMIRICVILWAAWRFSKVLCEIRFLPWTDRGLSLGKLTLEGIVSNRTLGITVFKSFRLWKFEWGFRWWVISTMFLDLFMCCQWYFLHLCYYLIWSLLKQYHWNAIKLKL